MAKEDSKKSREAEAAAAAAAAEAEEKAKRQAEEQAGREAAAKAEAEAKEAEAKARAAVMKKHLAEDEVIAVVPKRFTLVRNDHSRQTFEKGTQRMKKADAEHPYAKACGVTVP